MRSSHEIPLPNVTRILYPERLATAAIVAVPCRGAARYLLGLVHGLHSPVVQRLTGIGDALCYLRLEET
jgi:hypothetical protein